MTFLETVAKIWTHKSFRRCRVMPCIFALLGSLWGEGGGGGRGALYLVWIIPVSWASNRNHLSLMVAVPFNNPKQTVPGVLQQIKLIQNNMECSRTRLQSSVLLLSGIAEQAILPLIWLDNYKYKYLQSISWFLYYPISLTFFIDKKKIVIKITFFCKNPLKSSNNWFSPVCHYNYATSCNALLSEGNWAKNSKNKTIIKESTQKLFKCLFFSWDNLVKFFVDY